MTNHTKQRRVRMNTTIAGYTQAMIFQVAKDLALPNPGVTIDFIVNDWLNLKRLVDGDDAQPAGEAAGNHTLPAA